MSPLFSRRKEDFEPQTPETILTSLKVENESSNAEESGLNQERTEAGRDQQTGEEGALKQLKNFVLNLRSTKKSKTSAQTGKTSKDPLVKQVEKIMSEGLGDAYATLSPAKKEEFRIKGEETAKEIREMMKKTKVKVKKVAKLLLAWLRVLPGINVFFLEQEAKIKAEKILRLHSIERHRK